MSSHVSRLPFFRLGCGNGAGQEQCKPVLVGTIFGALPLFVAFVAFFANNWLIYSFVQRLTRRSNDSAAASKVGSGEKSQVESSTDFAGDEEIKEEESVEVRVNSPRRLHFTGQIRECQSSEPSPAGALAIQSKRDDFEMSLRHSLRQGSQTLIEEKPLQRLRLVQSQACLFVLAFFLTYIWSYALYIVEAVAISEEKETELFFTTFEWQVVRGIFLPLQGLFNMLVYARPKYLQNRHDFPDKSRLWAFQRAINGDSGDNSATFVNRQPGPPRPPAFPQKREDPNAQQTTKLAPPPPPFPDKMTGIFSPFQRKQGPALRNISSITASVGDFSVYQSGDSKFPGETENARWVLTPEEQGCSSPIQAKRYRSSTTLGSLLEENSTLNERPTAPVVAETPSPPADMSPRPPTRKKSPAVQTISISVAANKRRYYGRAAEKSSRQRDGLPIRPTRYASVEEGATPVVAGEESCSVD